MADEWSVPTGKRITLKFHGSLEQGFQVFWDIRTPSDHLIADGDGTLPLATHLDWQCNQWRTSYSELLGRLPTDWQGQSRAIKPTSIRLNGALHDQRERCAEQSIQLFQDFNQWLASTAFSGVEKQLVAHVQPIEDIHILIRTDDARLHYFPWHEWTFLDRYPQAEIGIAEKSFSLNATTVPDTLVTEDKDSSSNPPSVNILAIFGDSEGIDLSKDEAILDQLPNATLTVLKDCTREMLIDALDRQPWTILFFAGHGEKSQKSESAPETGWLYLNAAERISLEELRYSLRGAIDRGLQVAIFNSCQGMGLAYALAPLNMPSMVVMREEIPDAVAQRFLGYFLKAFAEESPLFLAVRRAREQVKQLMEHQFPGVSGLPIIWQSPAAKPMDWPPPKPQVKWWQPMLTTVGAIALTLGLRYLGLLQPLELNAYDHLMQLRPGQEGRDRRLLVVAVSEEDIQYQRDQGMTLTGSLSDDALGLLLQKLAPHQPSVIGLDIFHDFPFQPEVQAQIDQQNFVAICRARSAASQMAGISPPNPDYPAENLGFNNVPFDRDGVIRRQLLGMNAGEICPTNQAFNLRIAQAFLNQQANIIMEWVETASGQSMQMKLGQQVFPRLGQQSGGYHLPRRELGGYQILVNYRKTAPETVHLREILSGTLDSQLTELVRDRIILLGVIDPKTDTHLTPYSQGNETRRLAGVVIQAHMISQIIGAALGERSLLAWWPEWLEVIWISGWAIVGTGLVLLKRRLKHLRLPIAVPASVQPLLPLLLSGFALWGSCTILFTQGWWVPLIPAGLSLCGGFIATLSLLHWHDRQ